MVQIIPTEGSVFGQIGRGFGGGLAQQLPQEVERYRLSQGLKNLSQKTELTPFQQFAELSSIPGATPQMIESGSKLLRESARGQALSQAGAPKPSPFTEDVIKAGQPGTSDVPSITKEEPLAKIQEGYIPPTQEEIYSNAGKRYNQNPALFGNDPQKAIDAEIDRAARNQDIAEAYSKQHEKLSDIQDNVVKRLGAHSQKLGVDIPANVYSKVEDEAIQATKPKKDGGRGLTEQQAMKEYGEKLDQISRDYSSLAGVGNWSITGRPASESLRTLNSTQKKFEERNDTQNMADTLIGKNKLSPMTAYAIAEPVRREPKLNQEMKSLPNLVKSGASRGFLEVGDPQKIEKTLEVSRRLAPLLGEKGSPLAVAYELDKKGYDPQVWLEYVNSQSEQLNLRKNQLRQLEKPGSFAGTLNDWWLTSWTGLDEEGR